MVQSERMGSTSVKLWNDDRMYLIVSLAYENQWQVNAYETGTGEFGTYLNEFTNAKKAIDFATEYLKGGKEQLDKALNDSGLG